MNAIKAAAATAIFVLPSTTASRAASLEGAVEHADGDQNARRSERACM